MISNNSTRNVPATPKTLYDSFDNLSRVSIGLDDFFDGFFHAPLTGIGVNEAFPEWTLEYNTNTSGFPPYDHFKDEDGNYVLRMAVPGFSKEDLSVKMYNNVLYIEGKNEFSKESKEKHVFHSKIGKKNFKQKFNLPRGAENIDASLENGILEIKIAVPKPEDKAEQIDIEIR